jgi:hypothetical protein
MLSYLLVSLLFGASMVDHSGFVVSDKNLNARMHDGGEATGGLIVKMGPVINMRVADVRVLPGAEAKDALPRIAIAPKRSLFEGFSHNRLHAIRYRK